MNMGVAVTLGVLYFLWMSRRFVLAGRRRRRSLDSRRERRERFTTRRLSPRFERPEGGGYERGRRNA